MKTRAFRPLVRAAQLEDRIVLNGGHGHKVFPPAFVIKALSIPTTSVQTINTVGSAISLNYQTAGKVQASLTSAAQALTAPTPAQAIAYGQQSLNLYDTNLIAGLQAATNLLPGGTALLAQLTAPTTKLQTTLIVPLQKLLATPPTTPAAALTFIGQVAATTTSANINASATEANTILQTYVMNGVNSGTLRVIGYGTHGLAYLHVFWIKPS